MKKSLLTILTIITAVSISACGSSSDTSSSNEQAEDSSAETVEETAEETQEETEENAEEAPEEDTAETTESNYQWDAGNLAYLGLDRDQLLEIYNEYNTLLEDPSTMDMDPDEFDEYDEKCVEEVADKYGITAEDVNTIYFTAGNNNYFATFDVNNVTLKYGELQDLQVNGSDIVIKAKIQPSMTNNMTIEQNYFTVCDFIKKYATDGYNSIDYWAVADMTDGSEQKAISFVVPKKSIEGVLDDQIIENQLGDYVDDLWILPSLLE